MHSAVTAINETNILEQSVEPLSADDGIHSAASRHLVSTLKRRRVTRACDECCKRKIKCDGQRPCEHCKGYTLECTYDRPNNRKRSAMPQYVEALEGRVRRAEAILRAFLPNLDLDDPSFVAGIRCGAPVPPPQAWQPSIAKNVITEKLTGNKNIVRVMGSRTPSDGEFLVLDGEAGQLRLDEHGRAEYHGPSSDFSLIRQIRHTLDSMGQGKGEFSPLDVDPYAPQGFKAQASFQDPPAHLLPGGAELPSKEFALALCDRALNETSTFASVMHLPTFYGDVDKLYDMSHEQNCSAEKSSLPLFYAVLALGTLLSGRRSGLERAEPKALIDEGQRYFKAARHMLDITACYDLNALQTMIFIILFLQYSGNLSTCYTYIGAALCSALRMGLHRSMNEGFNPIEAETRRRLFWVIRKMDIYVGAQLGLPHVLNDQDIDQDFPADLGDEYITETKYVPQPANQTPVIAACNAHTALGSIISKIIRLGYHSKSEKSVLSGQEFQSFTISYANIRNIESELHQWSTNLPMTFKSQEEGAPHITRAWGLLRISYAYAQLMLYHPFMQYVSGSGGYKPADERAFACAFGCIRACRTVISISQEMMMNGTLAGTIPFSIHAMFLATMTLVQFASEDTEVKIHVDISREVNEAKKIFETLAEQVVGVDRYYGILKVMFHELLEHHQTPAKPSHEYDLLKQQTGLPSGLVPAIGMPNLNQPMYGTYNQLLSNCGIGFFHGWESSSSDIDMDNSSPFPASFLPGDGSQSENFVDPSAISQ